MTLEMLQHKIPTPPAWTTEDVEGKASFCVQLSQAQLAEIDDYLARVRGLNLDGIRVEDHRCGALRELVASVRTEVQHGRGMSIIQGCTLERYSREDFEKIFWLFGGILGAPISQSVFGEIIAHVRQAAHNPNNRSYRSSRELIHHTDTSDALGLMCIQTAKSGGLSSTVSLLALHNEILETRPELLPALYRGGPYTRLGQELPGQDPVTPYNVPIFSCKDGVLSCMYVRHLILQGFAALGKPADAELVQAMDYLDALATSDRFALRFGFESGDITFVNNRTVMHSRTEYQDYEEPELKRDLLRLWVDIPHDRRPVADELDPYQQPGSGGRGGVAHQAARATVAN